MTNRSTTGESSAPQATVFRYERPDLTRSKAVTTLCRSDLLFGAMQVIRCKGGENNLHSHPNFDGFWFVLSGRVRFYTTNDEVIAELGRHEGVLVPRDYPYWFESVSDDGAEVLQVEASAKLLRSDDDLAERIDLEPRRGLLAEMDAETPSRSSADGEV